MAANGDPVTVAHPSRLYFPLLKFYLAALVATIAIGVLVFLARQEAYAGQIPLPWQQLLLLLAVPAVLVVYIELHHYFHEYRFTREKVVEESGILARTQTAIPYENITETDTDASALERMVGVANLRVNTAGKSATEMHIDGIRHAERYKEIMEGKAEQLDRSDELVEALNAELGRVDRQRQELEARYQEGEVQEAAYEERWYTLQGEERALHRLLDRFE